MRPLAILTLLGIVAVIVWNYLANALPLNGITTGAISDAYPTLITPAGYTFSVWGVIYLGLLSFGIYQVLPASQNWNGGDQIRQLLLINLLLNGVWLLAFHYQIIWLSVLLMLGILGTLVLINVPLHNGLIDTANWVRWVFEVYLGWITVATLVNISVLVYDLGFFQDPTTGLSVAILIVLLIAGMGIASSLTIKWGAFALLLTVLWAFAGIGVKLSGNSTPDWLYFIPWLIGGIAFLGTGWAALRS